MTIKHRLQLKQNHNPPPRKCLPTCWLTKDIHKYFSRIPIPNEQQWNKNIKPKKPFHYQDIKD